MKLRLILLAGFAGFLGFAAPAPDRVVSPGFHVIATAEAVVGRPLTPVSAAGVARRIGATILKPEPVWDNISPWLRVCL